MPITWSQNYDPLSAWPLSTLVSALPVLTLLTMLVIRKSRVWVAALAGLASRSSWPWRSFGCRPPWSPAPADWAASSAWSALPG